MKWGVSGVLLAVLLLAWFAVDKSPVEAPASAAAGRVTPAAGVVQPAPPTLALQFGTDGVVRVRGAVADEATRNRWLNEIRIGAQGAKVVDELRVAAGAPAAGGWASQLSGLVALMRERRLESLRVEGDTVVLGGSVSNATEKDEADKVIQAQLPGGYRLDSRVALAPSAPGAPRAAASAGSSVPSTPAPVQKQDGRGQGATDRTPGDRKESEKLAQAGRQGEPAGKPAERKAAGCPPQLKSLTQPVYFKTDGASISAEDKARLQRLGECLGRARVRIVGHADPRLSDQYNKELSERRARAVADALGAGGLPASRISVVGAGSPNSEAKGVSPQVLQRSRRVDIQIR